MGYQLRFIEKYDIEAMARAVYSAGIQLADDRKEWLQLMMSMAGGGERLLVSFLLLASMAGRKFKERENRREFLKAVPKSCDTGLFFFIDLCRKKGISPNDYLAPAALADSYQSRSAWRQNNNHTNHNHQQQSSIQATTMQPFTTLPTANTIKSIDYKWVERFGQGQDSSFHRSVLASGLLTAEELQAASEIFHLGTTKDKRVVYWQIDAEGHVRDGKLMAYDEHCHRVKPGEHDTTSSVSWAGYEFTKCGLLDKDWEATHCLFGLHQLNSRPDDTVCIVEAEKTAVICSQKFKDCIWMAAGGLEQLSLDKLRPLVGRQVIIYPDTDPEGEAFRKWYEITWRAMSELEMDIAICDVLEKNATPEQKEAKIDLVDFIEKDILNANDAPVAEDMPAAEDDPVLIDVPANADEAPAIADTPSVIEDAVIVEKPKPSNTQLIVDHQREVLDARNMSQEEMLKVMAEENPNINFLVEAFGAVPEDSS
ncbi:MAG: hypothetical protein IKO08_06545 [Bacteroidales bacterium]|nr:hypothetical protein [Bacteroidales bacterium]